jgi:hypothetical protein
MSIDPNEFIKKENKPVKEEFDTITGSFSCQSCDESVDSAFYDEENRQIFWDCSCGKRNKARL